METLLYAALGVLNLIIFIPIARVLGYKAQIRQVTRKREAQQVITQASQEEMLSLQNILNPLSHAADDLRRQQQMSSEQEMEIRSLERRLSEKVSEETFSSVKADIASLDNKLNQSTLEEKRLLQLAQPIYDRLAREARLREEEARRKAAEKRKKEEAERKKREEEEADRARKRRQSSSNSGGGGDFSFGGGGGGFGGGGGGFSGGGASGSW